ncbi:hypothetical protein [Desulfosporosinus shakirovi]|uniref:hypothetical protein n=1 Tax=Desulfosporosinus shakirovi TaxID=2885154 RepID=UPI001E6557E0|nr:hypothetical protein [Desulfosporosinus sp. SRJS8]MCB8814731.1 hypothetical protein [Desulfosporosinus sp. SRJS8]
MSFKIYTYGNPYLLYQTSFWGEIKDAPHLCSSQVMVNAFRDLFETAFGSLLCPIDNVLKVAYSDWYNNIERRIAQYIAISNQLEAWKKRDSNKREELYASLKHNRGSLLEALRLFVELGIDVNSLHRSNANLEQKVFIALLNEINNPLSPLHEPFALTNDYSIDELVTFFKGIIALEIKREEDEAARLGSHYERRIQRIKKLVAMLDDFNVLNLKRVVVHGIHQFTPLQLRFIMQLDKLGVEVVFIYNYQPEYKDIYATWEHLYQLFGVPIERDTFLGVYNGTANSRSHNLAKAFGKLVDQTTQPNAHERLTWYQAGQQVEMLAFANITEYAGFVSSYFDKALKENRAKPIPAMMEKVYTAGREVHDLLRIYYPEQSGDLHFLNYPIGQFFLGLYRMWDPLIGQLRIDWASIKECFTAGILRVPQSEKLNSILEITSAYFEDIKLHDQFIVRIAEYKKQYKTIQIIQNDIGEQLRRIAFYRPSMISLEDIESFESAVNQLNDIASHLFANNVNGSLSFLQHFQRLEEFIRNQLLNLVEAEEKKLVESLLERFDQVNNNTTLSGSMEDLKSGLYYYLKQKDLESPDWIVRNFVQIEGDILHSRAQHRLAVREGKEDPIYHFACLSDRMLNQTMDDLLPWPLSDYFIRKAYSPIALIFQVYYASLGDSAKFLRYAFFYGLCYNECPVRLSYVVHVEDNEEQPYFPLRMLGIKPKIDEELESLGFRVPKISVDHKNSTFIASRLDMMDFFLCPYKYYLDMVCRGDIVIDNAFLLKRYYSNMLVQAVWKRMEGKPKMNNSMSTMHSILKSTQDAYRQYFPFYRDANDLHDLMHVAENYINHNLWDGRMMKRYDESHMNIRFLFQKASYYSEDLIPHPFAAFDVKTVIENGNKKYSLHKIHFRGEETLLHAMQEYMEIGINENAVIGDWCNSCAHQKLCLKPYQAELSFSIIGGE